MLRSKLLYTRLMCCCLVVTVTFFIVLSVNNIVLSNKTDGNIHKLATKHGKFLEYGSFNNIKTSRKIKMADVDIASNFIEKENIPSEGIIIKKNTFSKNIIKKRKLTECEPIALHPKHTISSESVSCKPHLMSTEACNYVKKIYKQDDTLKTCGSTRKINICKYKQKNNRFQYVCNMQDCLKYNTKWARIKAFDPKSKTLVEKGIFSDSHMLTIAVEKVAVLSIKNGYNFMFIECTNKEKDLKPFQILSQFFILPPHELLADPISLQVQKSKKKTEKKKSNITVNIILLDSAARAHFIRSLPTTIQAMNNINKISSTEILDFELFQSIDGHTAENLKSLFTGEPFPKNFTPSQREHSQVGIGGLFNRFIEQGYSSYYHDDLCYNQWWGVRLDLGSPRSWKDLTKKLSANGINNTGLMFSSCHILEANNVTNPFNGPKGPLCFNGEFHDAYYLEYSYTRHKFASENKKGLISFTGLNVAHEHTGRRIQAIDLALAEYVKKITQAENTITLLLADHGNTYTHYTHAIMEGGFEQYHPSFYMIIPDQVKETLGDKIMNNLRQNQKKLVTMIDIHEALKYIPDEIQPTGLFSNIPTNRTCDDLNLRLPNLCVCEGWDAETLNNSRQVGMLDFAVGQLNNMIAVSQKDLYKKGRTPRCHRLVPTKFINVRERNREKYFVTSLDFYVLSGKGADDPHDVFHVEVQSIIEPNQHSRNMTLLSFDRLSKYGPYSACSDPSIIMRLCVCDLDNKAREETNIGLIKNNMMQYHQLFPTDLIIKSINKINNCIYFRTVSYPELKEDKSIFSSSYDVANICEMNINVTLTVIYGNMKTTSPFPISRIIYPFSIIYIGGCIRDVPYWNSHAAEVKFVAKIM